METTLPLQQYHVEVEGKKFGIRAGAYIIDTIIYLAAHYAITFVIYFIVGVALVVSGRAIQVDEQSNQCLGFIIGLIQLTLYFTIYEWLYGATPGKLILGMRVVTENGEPCDFRAAFIRSLIRYFDGFFFGIPAYASMKPPLYQRIGDRDAKTIVVGAKEEIIQQPREWWWFLLATALYILINATVVFIQAIAAIS